MLHAFNVTGLEGQRPNVLDLVRAAVVGNNPLTVVMHLLGQLGSVGAGTAEASSPSIEGAVVVSSKLRTDDIMLRARRVESLVLGDKSLVVIDIDGTLVAMGNDGPVLGEIVVSEIVLNLGEGLASGLHLERLCVVGAECPSAFSLSFKDGILSLGAALRGVALGPFVGGDPDILVNFRDNGECVLSFALSFRGMVVEHEEVIVSPALVVVVGCALRELCDEVVNVHVEDTIFSVLDEADLSFELGSPQRGFVAPVAVVVLPAVRVPDFAQPDAVGEHVGTDEGEGVTLNEATCARRLIGAGRGAASHDVVVGVVSNKLGPEVVGGDFVVKVDVVGGAGHGLDGDIGSTALDMGVVAVVLGEGLLDDGDPHGAVSAEVREQGAIVTVPKLAHGQPVIDNDGVGDAESVEVDAVGTLRVELSVGVEEDLLHAAGPLSNGRAGREEPAVAEGALDDVISADAIAEESLARGSEINGTLPGVLGSVHRVLLTHVSPVHGVLVVTELGVVEGVTLIEVSPLFEVRLEHLVDVSSRGASVSGSPDLGEFFNFHARRNSDETSRSKSAEHSCFVWFIYLLYSSPFLVPFIAPEINN